MADEMTKADTAIVTANAALNRIAAHEQSTQMMHEQAMRSFADLRADTIRDIGELKTDMQAGDHKWWIIVASAFGFLMATIAGMGTIILLLFKHAMGWGP